MQPYPWTAEQIPDLTGKYAIVTGGNSGLGYYTTLELARHGAHVIMASRNLQKAESARQEMIAQAPTATIELIHLDLARMESIHQFSEDVEKFGQLHILVNNAGVMANPYQKTENGYEKQLGINHLGHFALTGLLLPTLLKTDDSRVVTVASTAARKGRMNFDDLMSENSYGRLRAYRQSKLANLLFFLELSRRLQRMQAKTRSVAAHPGLAATNLPHTGLKMEGSAFLFGVARLVLLFSQSAEMGALPQLYAATMPDVQSGDYYGPDGPDERRGYPKKIAVPKHAQDEADALRLWELSELLTGVQYPVTA